MVKLDIGRQQLCKTGNVTVIECSEQGGVHLRNLLLQLFWRLGECLLVHLASATGSQAGDRESKEAVAGRNQFPHKLSFRAGWDAERNDFMKEATGLHEKCDKRQASWDEL